MKPPYRSSTTIDLMNYHRFLSSAFRVTSLCVFSLCIFSLGCTQNSNSEKKESVGRVDSNPKISSNAQQRLKEYAEATLDEKKQEFIHQSEHITFEIERVFGKEWKSAFKAKDVARLTKFLLPEFAGKVIQSEDWKTKTASVVSEKSRAFNESDAETSELAKPENLSEYLVEISKKFESISQLKFRVLQIKRPIDDQPIWSCKILIDVVGEDSQKHPQQFESEQAVVFEIRNKAELASHPVIAEWNVEKETWRQSDRYLMEEVTEAALLHEAPLLDNWTLDLEFTEQYWFQFAVEDYNLDGSLDIAIASNMAYPILMQHNRGNRYLETAAERNVIPIEGAIKVGSSFGCAWLDYDNDGYPDLILGNKLYHNNQGLEFKDVTFDSNLLFQRECMGINIADYDCDGLLDIYMLYQSPAVRPQGANVPEQWVNETNTGYENQLWKNIGNGKFKNVTKVANAGGGKRHTHAANWFFYDDDPFPDLYIANDFGKNVLLRNKGDGTFEDISEKSQSEGYSTSMGVSTGDLNNDGKTEIYVANMYSKMGRRIIGQVSDDDYPEGIYPQIQGSCAGNRLYTRSDDGPFKEIGEKNLIHDVGWAFGPTFMDVDGDGLLDIYATTGFMSFDREKPDG